MNLIKVFTLSNYIKGYNKYDSCIKEFKSISYYLNVYKIYFLSQ